jgi:hypothetical protein
MLSALLREREKRGERERERERERREIARKGWKDTKRITLEDRLVIIISFR